MRRYKLNFFLVLSLAQMGLCSADTFTIVNGQIETTTQTLNDPGGTGLIESGGTIETTSNNEHGVEMLTGTDQVVTNDGTIKTGGSNASGIFSTGADATISNSGSITTKGVRAYGIISNGANATISNSGSIATEMFIDAYGIRSNGINATITNSGSITTTGNNGRGIFSNGANATITNSGSITTTEGNGRGISSNGANATITNSGSIITEGSNAYGIYSTRPDATISNSGSIATKRIGANGIFSIDDDATINNSGSILTQGVRAFGIYSTGANATISNSGSIKTEGGINAQQSAYGIYSTGPDATITNSGSIATEGDDASGIVSEGNNATIANCGTIATKGAGAHGINSIGADATITNRGRITTQGEFADGIFSSGANATIANCGTIATKGMNAHGIYSTGGDATITNRGRITTKGDLADGIVSEGNNATITNCGNIATYGTGADGIRSEGDNLKLTNAGTISSKQSLAINLLGANPTFTVQKCSEIIGPVHSTSDLNVNTKKGVNLLLTLDEASSGFGDLNIEGLYAVKNNKLAVVDTRGFAMQPDIVADLSDTLLNGVDNPCYTCGCGHNRSFWVQGVGYIRERGRDFDRYQYHQGGFLIGFDTSYCKGSRLSVFGGAVFGQNNKKVCDVSLKSDNYVGGLHYERCICNGSVSYSGVFGFLSLDQTRPVFYNLAVDGILDAKSTRSGFFTAQEVNLQQRLSDWCYPPELTATVRYVGFFPGCSKEKRDGFPCNRLGEDLVLDNQSINFVVTRLLAGLPFSTRCMKVEPYLGAAGRFQLNGHHQKGTLLGKSICFSNWLPENITSLLFGVKGCYSLCGVECNLNLEGSKEGAYGSRFVGTGGLSFSY